MEITKEHVSNAKEFTSESSKIYSFVKKRFQEQEGIYTNLIILGSSWLEDNDSKQSRNHMNNVKSTDEMKGKVTDYYIQNKLNSKRENLGSSDAINFEETKATNRLKDTLEKLTIERDTIKDDRDKLLQL